MTQVEHIRSAQSGNQESIDHLVAEHMAYIKAIARRYPPQVRDDVLQLGVLGFLEAVNRFNVNSGLKLITFAAWRIKGAMKNMKREGLKEVLFDDIATNNEIENERANIETIVAQPETPKLEQKLRDAIRTLPDIEQEILKMFFFDGMDMRSIGAIVQLSHQRVHQLKNRAVQHLKTIMGIEE